MTAAWLVALPCAALTAVAVVTIGPWLGQRVLPARATVAFLNVTKHPDADARQVGLFLVSLAGPILLSLAIVAATRRGLLVSPRVARTLVVLAQAFLVAAIAVCFQGQRRPQFGFVYFSNRTLLVSAGIALALLAAGTSERLRRALGAQVAESHQRRLAIGAAAAAITMVWMLPALETDHSIEWADSVLRYHTAFYLDEAFSVLNGLTPLVTFTPQYGALWPYVISVPMLAFGKSLLTFTAAMSVATSIALLAVFGVLRRVTRNSPAALLLFVPFLATTLFPIGEGPEHVVTLGAWFAFYPLRYAGPLLLAWMTARHLSGPATRRPWPLFAVAGIVVMNNVDAGVAALGASIAALLWAAWPRTRPQALALAANAIGGLALAVAIVASVTLLRSGSLPHFSQLTEFARIFALNGYNAVPKPGIRGLILIIYGTFAGAIGTATVLALRRNRDPVLTGMLAWVGVFGLGSASYYVARDVLPTLFSPWALAVALLAVVAFRSQATRPRRSHTAMTFVVLFGFGITACSIAQVPAPWSQIHRLRHPPPGQQSLETPLAAVPSGPPDQVRWFMTSLADGPHRFVARHGAPAAILATTGHRIADAFGIRDVTPYAGFESILTVEQAERTIDVLRHEGGNTVLLPRLDDYDLNRILIENGFEILTKHGLHRPRPSRDENYLDMDLVTVSGFVKWVDTRHLHPAALR